MVPLEVWLLGGATVAFGATLWLLVQHERQGQRAFAQLADQRGWDCRSEAPPGLLGHLLQITRMDTAEPAELYLSGPASVGPFQLVRAGGPTRGVAREEALGTFLHVRTPVPCRGLWVRPAERFRPGAPQMRGARASFARRFSVEAIDPEDAERRLDDETLSILLRPQTPVRIGWEGHDLVIAFPLGVSSPHGALTLIHYGSALAARLCGQAIPAASDKRRSPAAAGEVAAPGAATA